MRLRRIPGTQEILAGYQGLVIRDPLPYQGRWREFFGNNHPIHLELGMGRGKFIATIAQCNPQINFLGMEFREEMVMSAVKKLGEYRGNVAFLWFDGEHILDSFIPGEISRIYLNFSDPWPKKRHAKRRLTHRNFLAKYHQILEPGGDIHFKTDNRDFFEFSLQEFSDYGLDIRHITYDLYQLGYEENITTEYEEKFVRLGKPIFRCEAIFPMIDRSF